MRLTLLPGSYAIARLEPGAAVPGWAAAGELWSVTRTAHELSIVCEESQLTGDAGVSIFALSTYDTDHILVRREDLDKALAALRRAGHTL